MDANDIRRAYLDFIVERGHVVIPRAPLIPRDDPTTLFTGSACSRCCPTYWVPITGPASG